MPKTTSLFSKLHLSYPSRFRYNCFFSALPISLFRPFPDFLVPWYRLLDSLLLLVAPRFQRRIFFISSPEPVERSRPLKFNMREKIALEERPVPHFRNQKMKRRTLQFSSQCPLLSVVKCFTLTCRR
ncbi:MAG: hypothetical protein D6679_01635 [Candidatus Hydrogenedentota bacterium]|nr:MAG: hypothetical protein D6679_01635 [Candidatus Hydrogenedentota bacterium]